MVTTRRGLIMGEPLTLERVERCVNAVPALPQAVSEVLHAVNDEHVSLHRCVGLIEHDQALAARTLRVANSAFYGMPGRVGSIGDAVALLGLRAVSGVLVAAAVVDSVKLSGPAAALLPSYWRHALAAGLFARELASRVSLDADEAFTAGLLHDIGRLVLAAHYPDADAQAMALARSSDVPQVEAERAALGLTHAEIGERLIAHWHFPERVVYAVCHHHDRLSAAEAPHAERGDRDLAALIQVCDAMTHALDLSGAEHEAVPDMDTTMWLRLHLMEDEAVTLLGHVESSVTELCRNLQV
jgi:putative nucleotidyltransferase with HDIG domain